MEVDQKHCGFFNTLTSLFVTSETDSIKTRLFPVCLLKRK